MCGIFLSASRQGAIPPSEELVHRLGRRGPDAIHATELRFAPTRPSDAPPSAVHLSVCATVLSLRGEGVTQQPIGIARASVGADGPTAQRCDEAPRCLLCWNGEAWKVDDEPVVGNDAERVFDVLAEASRRGGGVAAHGQRSVVETLMRITGPFAFVLVDRRGRRVVFGRDCLGRRSLLYKVTPGIVMIASVSDGSGGWREVEADGIYALGLDGDDRVADRSDTPAEITAHVAFAGFQLIRHAYADHGKTFTLNRSLPQPTLDRYAVLSQSARELERRLQDSLRLRLSSLAPIASIPADHPAMHQQSRIAILFSGGLDCTILARMAHDHLPEGESIDLLNVAFENPRIHHNNDNDNHPNKGESQATSPYDTCPDRLTARTSHTTLQQTCPSRRWHLIEINIPYAETTTHRPTIHALIAPHNTEMDMSIACALYFAARGLGTLAPQPQAQSPTSTSHGRCRYGTRSRVLLSGLGADELFAGYTRHATAFNRGSYPALLDELSLDLSRLGLRNLGRDDRVIAHWGREARYPYLDEEVVRWSVNVGVGAKVGFGLEGRGGTGGTDVGGGTDGLEPGKLVLRLLARRMGLGAVAAEKKRAIQFGARTARMERAKGRSRGTDVI